MESKFKLRLDQSVDLNSINAGTILCLSTEYLIDLIKDVFKKYNKDDKLKNYLEEYTSLVDASYNVSFSNFSAWISHKSNVFVKLLDVVKRCDGELAGRGVCAIGQVVGGVQVDLNEFAMSLGTIVVDYNTLSLNGAVVKKEYIDSTIEQLTLMNESYVLCRLSKMQIEMSPLDLENENNLVTDKKLKSLDTITTSAKNEFDSDGEKLLDDIQSMYLEFYKLSNSKLTDSEKVESARKIVKGLNSHKKLLDKIENKLTKGNELKRQLKIHKNKLLETLESDTQELSESMKNDSANGDIYEQKLATRRFVTDKYVAAIDIAINNINSLEEGVADRYKKLDLLNSSLKAAIPTEGELKKLSAVSYKFQELANKQENAKTTLEDKGLKSIISTTIQGLKALVVAGNDLKEMYLRNSMVSATFKVVDVMLDFAENDNKAIRLKNMIVVNTNLEKYSKLAIKMAEDFFAARKLATDSTRNVAMLMCKPYTKKSLNDIAEQINLCYAKLDELLKTLETCNKEEIDLIKEILSL